MDVAAVSRFSALLALLVGVAAVAVWLSVVWSSGPLRGLREGLTPVALTLGFLIAAGATSGSLYFSEVAHFVPCKLCWFQRIAMYPLALILGIAALRRDRTIWRYGGPLAALGGLVSIYHVQLERFPDQTTFCSAEAPCSLPPIQEFGFVTLAFMALCAFAAITSLLAVSRRSSPQHQESLP